MDYTFFPTNGVVQFRPNKGVCFIQYPCADGTHSAFFTQGDISDRSSRNYALG
jgi:hypothetical protein